MIAIIDYDAGNLRSVTRTFERAGAQVVVTDDAALIEKADGVVLPGVGAFGDCMASLKRKGMDRVAKASIEKGKPFLGICLGFQMLFESSQEHGPDENDVEGLCVFQGKIKRFPPAPGIKVPHMGWNRLEFQGQSPLFANLPPEPYVYFVHSYYLEAKDPGLVSARCRHGIAFDAAISRENVHGVQFHPEKSGDTGYHIIKNFIKAVYES